jgi:transposase-like protein
MPSKPNKNAVTELPRIPKELIESFVSGPLTAEVVNAASLAFKKALIERILGAELSHHLGYAPGGEKPGAQENCRNGVSSKTLQTETGAIRIEVPRDRDGSFAPLLVPKHARRFTGFDDKIIALYARGMTLREIQGFLREQYGVDVSADCTKALE